MSMTVSNATITYPLSMAAATEFDYEGLPDIEVEALEASAESIRTAIDEGRSMLTEVVLAIGTELASVQERLANHGNGNFLEWCNQACGLSKSSVYNYLAAIRAAKDCPTIGQSSEVSALYVLGAKSCPDEARTRAIELVEDGEFITVTRAKELVRDCATTKKSPRKAKKPPMKSVVEVSEAGGAFARILECAGGLQEEQMPVTEIVAALRRVADELEGGPKKGMPDDAGEEGNATCDDQAKGDPTSNPPSQPSSTKVGGSLSPKALLALKKLREKNPQFAASASKRLTREGATAD